MRKIILLIMVLPTLWAYYGGKAEVTGFPGNYALSLEYRSGKTHRSVNGDIIGHSPPETSIGITAGLIHNQPYGRLYAATVKELVINESFGLTSTIKKGVGYLSHSERLFISFEGQCGIYYNRWALTIGYETTVYHLHQIKSKETLHFSLSYTRAILQ